MPRNTISLPAGHTWKEKDAPSACTYFECEKCGAFFSHDFQDDSIETDADDDTCEDSTAGEE